MRFIDGRTDAPMEPDPAEEKVLGDSTGVVIVYGAADTSWFVTKVQRTNQLRRRPQTLWGAVVDAPVPGKRPAPSAQSIERHDWAKGPDFESMRRCAREPWERPRMFELRDITKPYPGLRPFKSWETEIFSDARRTPSACWRSCGGSASWR